MMNNSNVGETVRKIYREFKDHDNLSQVIGFFLGQAQDYQVVQDYLKLGYVRLKFDDFIVQQAYKDTLELYR